MTEPTPDSDSDGGGEHGMTRRQLMRHSAWFGGAVVLTVTAGEVISHIPGSAHAAPASSADLRFVQVSDSHIGFQGPANMDVVGTFGTAINQVNSSGSVPTSSCTAAT